MTAWGGQWLTTAGKLILVKFVLSSLPIYQASFLLAPKMITEQLSKLIRNFLWQGGKGNQKKNSFGKLGYCEKAFTRRRSSGKGPRIGQFGIGRKDFMENLLKSTTPCKPSSH
jgi:hypothetical protein